MEGSFGVSNFLNEQGLAENQDNAVWAPPTPPIPQEGEYGFIGPTSPPPPSALDGHTPAGVDFMGSQPTGAGPLAGTEPSIINP